MKESKLTRYFLIGLSLVFLYLAFITIQPVLQAIILALVFAFAFYPIYRFVRKRINSPNWSATIMLILILLIIVIPSIFFVDALVKQSYNTYEFIQTSNFKNVSNILPDFMSDVDIKAYLNDMAFEIRNLIVNQTPGLIGSITQLIVGLAVFLFVLFYALRDGEKLISWLQSKNALIKDIYVKKLLSNIGNMTSGIIYGYLLTALVQGILGGIMFVILGIPNAIFWTFIMIILAAIPIVGTPIVWIPAALIELYNGSYVSGIILLVFGFTVLINIDNVMRPRIIGSKTNIHPVIILIGIVGGLSVFGFIGLILGPIFLALFLEIFKFLRLEFS